MQRVTQTPLNRTVTGAVEETLTTFTVTRPSLYTASLEWTIAQSGTNFSDPTPLLTVAKNGDPVFQYTPSISRSNYLFPFHVSCVLDPGDYTLTFTPNRDGRSIELLTLYEATTPL